MDIRDIKTDCKHFVGYVPCKPNKNIGVHCLNNDGTPCNYYSHVDERILIIKLGAAGDVLRSTPLLYPLRNKYPRAHITWLTHYPELLPDANDNSYGVDLILDYGDKSISVIRNSTYSLVINLDKDPYACSLAKEINNNPKMFGYTLVNNKPYPVNEFAQTKYLTGIFDDISIANKKSYLDELFEICGFNFKKEEYILPNIECDFKYDLDKSKKIIGLNTGCGARWTSRLWPYNYWKGLIEILKKEDFEIILLGGPEEHEKNLSLQAETSVKYFNVMPIRKFICLMKEADIIVSSVTMAMHIAIGLKKQLILLNNIFNKNEFELYNRGFILEPEKVCKCYFRPSCINDEYKCIEYIFPETVFNAIKSLKL